jgi:hypothetical protein
MCDVPRVAVSCSESIECFLGMASKFILEPFVTIIIIIIIIIIIECCNEPSDSIKCGEFLD